MTHAEALVYAAAFGSSIVRSGADGRHSSEGRARVAARLAWVAVCAFRECPMVAEDGGKLSSLDMLAEFKAFGEETRK